MSERLNPGLNFYHDTSESDKVGTISVRLPENQPVDPNFPYHEIEGYHLVERCFAAWNWDNEKKQFQNHDNEMPFPIRLVGPAGSGKNALVFHLANQLQRPLYILQGHEELTPEDLVISAAIRDDSKIEYIASPLVASMVTGGICFFDEIGKLRGRGLAPLSSVLDERLRIYSALLGRWIVAHKEFLFISALNPEDPETFDLPPYIKSRTLEIPVPKPTHDDLEIIIRTRNPNDEHIQELARDARREAEESGLHLSTRDLLYIVDYAERIERLYQHLEFDEQKSAVQIAIDHCIEKERRS